MVALLELGSPHTKLVVEILHLLNATGLIFTTRLITLQVLPDHTNPVVAIRIADDRCYREVRRHAVQIAHNYGLKLENTLPASKPSFPMVFRDIS